MATATAGPPVPYAVMPCSGPRRAGEGRSELQTAISVRSEGEPFEPHVDTTLLKLSIAELSTGAKDVLRSTAETEIISRQRG